jgi:hypothetical protein
MSLRSKLAHDLAADMHIPSRLNKGNISAGKNGKSMVKDDLCF